MNSYYYFELGGIMFPGTLGNSHIRAVSHISYIYIYEAVGESINYLG